jgi:Tfp pilus assembly ATPase PilU
VLSTKEQEELKEKKELNMAYAHDELGRFRFSVLLGTARVRELMKKGDIEALKDAMAQGENEGMQTFDHALFELFRDGHLSLEEALSNANSVTDLKLRIKLAV